MASAIRQFIRENIRFAMGLDRYVTMNALCDVAGTRHTTNPEPWTMPQIDQFDQIDLTNRIDNQVDQVDQVDQEINQEFDKEFDFELEH